VSDDESLLARCRRGDQRAWRAVVDRYERLVYSIPLQFGLSRADADDIAQTTFAALVRSLDSITDEERLGSWLATVARRQTWRLVERRRSQPTTDNDAAVDQLSTADDVTSTVDNLQWVHQGLQGLDPKCRALVTALYLGAESPAYTDVARDLDIPLGSIGPTRARCLEKLRFILQSLQGE
jgi:RNA polymerase sigma factor (sigma-70 family)